MRDKDAADLVRIMTQRHLTLAVAESLTAGRLQCEISAISGASDFFEGGITAYSLAQKVKHLDVDPTHAERVNCVSRDVARQMASGVCRAFETDIGIGTTGYAEPNRQLGVRTPHAYYAIWRADSRGLNGQLVTEGYVDGENNARVAMQEKVAAVSITALLEYLRRDVEASR